MSVFTNQMLNQITQLEYAQVIFDFAKGNLIYEFIIKKTQSKNYFIN